MLSLWKTLSGWKENKLYFSSQVILLFSFQIHGIVDWPTVSWCEQIIQQFKEEICTISKELQQNPRACVRIQRVWFPTQAVIFLDPREVAAGTRPFCVCFSWGVWEGEGGWRLEREWCQSHNGFNMWMLSSTHWSPSWPLKVDRNRLISASWLHVPQCFEKVQTDWYLHNKNSLASTVDWWCKLQGFAKGWLSHCRPSPSPFVFGGNPPLLSTQLKRWRFFKSLVSSL